MVVDERDGGWRQAMREMVDGGEAATAATARLDICLTASRDQRQ